MGIGSDSLHMEPEATLLHVAGAEPQGDAFSFERWCRQPGTRINAIMTMIEQGLSDHEIRKLVRAEDDTTIGVYRRALMAHRGGTPQSAAQPDPLSGEPREAEPEEERAEKKEPGRAGHYKPRAPRAVRELPEGMKPWPPSPRPDGRRRITAEMIADVARLRALKWTRPQIAEALHATEQAIRTIYRSYVKTGKTISATDWRAEASERVRRLIEAGRTRKEIALETGMKEARVDYLMYQVLDMKTRNDARFTAGGTQARKKREERQKARLAAPEPQPGG